MNPVTQSNLTRFRIEKCYKGALCAYAAPFVLLVFGLLLSAVSGEAAGFFFVAAALSLLPLGIGGLVATLLGLRLAIKTNDYQKKDIGYANLLLGIVLSGLGLVVLAFAYLRTS